MSELFQIGKINYHFDRVSSFKEITPTKYGLYFEEKFSKHIPNSNNIKIIKDKGNITAFAIFGKNELESNFLNMNVLTIYHAWAENFSDATKLITSIEFKLIEEYDFIVYRPSSNNIFLTAALSNHGYMLVDTQTSYLGTKNTFYYDLLKKMVKGKKIKKPTPDDYNNIRSLCKKSFAKYPSKYFVDPNIGSKKSTELYLRWFEDAKERNNQRMYVSFDKNDKFCTFGFVEIYDEELFVNHFGFKYGYSGWTGVIPRCRDKDAYLSIISKLILSLANEKIYNSFLDTQIFNKFTQNIAIRIGGTPTYTRHTFHKKLINKT